MYYYKALEAKIMLLNTSRAILRNCICVWFTPLFYILQPKNINSGVISHFYSIAKIFRYYKLDVSVQ